MKRRQLLATLGAGLAATAGCTGRPRTGADTTPSTTTRTTTREYTDHLDPTKSETTETENTTTEADVFPDTIAPVKPNATDGWRSAGHDSNRTRYNAGGGGPSSKPELQYKIAGRTGQVTVDGYFYREKGDAVYGNKLQRIDLDSGDREDLGELDGSPIALYGNTVYCSSIQELSAFDLDEGQKSWTYNVDFSSKVIHAHEYENLLVAVFTNHVAGLTKMNGTVTEAWRVTPDNPDEFKYAWYLPDSVIVTDSDAKHRRIGLESGDVIESGKGLLDKTSAEALSGISGNQPLANLGAESDQVPYTSQVCVRRDGMTLGLQSLKSTDTKWIIETDAYPYALADNTVYIGDGEFVQALDAESGEEKWRVETEEQWRYKSVIPTDGKLLVQTQRDTLVYA